MRISSLHIYPVKSGRGIDLETSAVEARGLVGDRRWMIVDEHGIFITQRSHPKLAQLIALPRADGLELKLGAQNILVKQPIQTRANVQVWSSHVDALICDDNVNSALSEWLGENLSLAYMDDNADRQTDSEWDDGPVSFADGYPILITTSASLEALNEHIIQTSDTPIPMSRFRPNIVIEGSKSWADDGWATIQIGDLVLDLVKPCTRCGVTTLDQMTGVSQGQTSLAALHAIRKSGDRRVKGVLFGWNAIPRNKGRLNTGDKVSVLKRKAPWPIA